MLAPSDCRDIEAGVLVGLVFGQFTGILELPLVPFALYYRHFLRVDGRTIHLRHAGAKDMSWAGHPAAPVSQALRWLGQRQFLCGH